MSWLSWRKKWVSKPLFSMARKALPPMSRTEQEAIEAGDVWWESQLFSGKPDWSELLSIPAASLTVEEQAFIDGPVTQLLAMLDEWQINQEDGDLSPEIWQFLKQQGFFGMIIPKDYGGLGFSAFAHSEVVKRISIGSITAAVTVMVPNSLGPGELLLQFGTPEQRQYWLPRLASGEEIPCFGLTSPDAGSDAASMRDTGVVCWQDVDGEAQLGIRLNFNKRYITLSPIATVLGVAFKLSDPDHLLSEQTDLGITLALVEADRPGVQIGRRHYPAMQVFQNGPMHGKDVFIPLTAIIGGAEMAGHGWKMLMSALSAGRGISLPSLSAAACVFSAHTTGAYARIRQQFGVSIAEFEGVQEALSRLAVNAYVVEAARRLSCEGLDLGVKPSVVSAIMKLQATERMRDSVNAAMDVHAGKAVIDGPRNYLGQLYRAVPVAITVEGANILTRSLIVFGQGAIRAHPWLMKEINALSMEDSHLALDAFDEVVWKHARHSLGNLVRAFALSWTGAYFSKAPRRAGEAARFYRRLNRCSAVYAVVAEACLFSLGGALKRKEMLSARLGDLLSEQFLMSAVLKRWHDEGSRAEDLPVVTVAMQEGFYRFDRLLRDVLSNLPSRPLAWVLNVLLRPFGYASKIPHDRRLQAAADTLTQLSEARTRLVGDAALASQQPSVLVLQKTFAMAARAQTIMRRLRKEGYKHWPDAPEHSLSAEERALLVQYAELEQEVIAVDDFPADAFERAAMKPKTPPQPQAYP